MIVECAVPPINNQGQEISVLQPIINTVEDNPLLIFLQFLFVRRKLAILDKLEGQLTAYERTTTHRKGRLNWSFTQPTTRPDEPVYY
jgi:hypothetical protein